MWEEFGDAIEKDFQSAPKRFRQTIRRLRRGKRGSIQTVHSKGGTLLTSTEEVIGLWKEHFEELLNPTNPPSTVERRGWRMKDGKHQSPHCGSQTSPQWQNPRG
ncbi:hypothetical protein NHX12_014742 [Muraenolepis orangiensis]|uniref:Uncharacterized protein n=1 Tax=Muraenolepis orangiensis TaxID=630683 RepID=A0A9Q0I5E3_9TELE|nr:hypothetical protein NHX12_014742 [Muraenolepis orangiensis]